MLKKSGFLYLGIVLAIGGYWFWSGQAQKMEKIPTPEEVVKNQLEAEKKVMKVAEELEAFDEEEVVEEQEEEIPTQNALPEEVLEDERIEEALEQEPVPSNNDNVLNGEGVGIVPDEEFADEDVTSKWMQTSRDLMVKELGFSEKEYEDYLNLRDRFENERMQAFSDFYDEMASKYGDSYSFEPSQEMKEAEARIKQDYLDQLRGRLGEEGYLRYQQELKNFNEGTTRRFEGRDSVPFIEF